MKSTGYFHSVREKTPTRVWINNPTVAEAKAAIEAGAVGCTTNPAYVSKLLSSPADRAFVERTIALLSPHISDEATLASLVQRVMVSRLSDLFLPMYQASQGRYGYVTIQSDPHREEDASFIVSDGLENRKIGENIMVKIPVTTPGIEAISDLVAKNIPTMATEMMGISQAVSIAEAYQEASQRSGHAPPFYFTHITGILDDHFKRVISGQNLDISQEAVKWAGLSIAKKQYHLDKERGYPGTMIGGGARKLEDFTELVGGDLHVTINWKGTAETLISLDPPVESKIDTPVDPELIRELRERLPDFERAWDEQGMQSDEYYDYGGVELFRTSFMKGWDTLVSVIRDYRREN